MRTIPIVEAKSHFSALLSEVEAGEEIAITRHGRVVARIVPDRPRMAADVFRPFWGESDIDLEAPSDALPEPVPPLE
jgi:prevent-host-death family protein